MTNDLGMDPPPYIGLPLEPTRAREVLGPLLTADPDVPKTVCCYNDDVGIAALMVARTSGLRVPEEVAVIGVDHSAIGQLMTPPLTTVHVDFGRLSALIALEILQPPSGVKSGPDPFRLSDYVYLHRGGTS